LETPVWLPYAVALLGLVLIFYFLQTPGLNLKHPKASEFENATFILGILVFLAGVVLYVRRSREAT